ncbi:hypothetical protein [Streptomyces virginiae]|uniref:hypothetical protein n=1 Tax=Streptomyces virginiae TaxID=1961 RepID=UPI000526A73D|nr:hypothetical protein [Streptomyces virginiae]MCX4718272.1 hypothetical protein [Streptomyces virginiae]
MPITSRPDPTPQLRQAVDSLTGYAAHYSLIRRRLENSQMDPRNGYGLITVPGAAFEVRVRDLAEAFKRLLPHVPVLLESARAGIDAMPPARHHPGWRLLLDDLAHAANQASRPVNITDGRGDRLWPYLQTWGERATLLRDLALQPQQPHPDLLLSAPEEELWTAHARSARLRGLLQPMESRYDAEGRQITVATALHPEDPDEEVVLVMAGDIDSPGMRVIGHYDSHDDAIAHLPPAVPPGVLYPAGPPTVRDRKTPSLADLTRDVASARHSGEVAEVISYVTDHPVNGGHLAELTALLDTCTAWASAMDTRVGHDLAARLRMVAAQTRQLGHELRLVGEDMDAAVAVLPPYRTPAPRHLQAPATPALTTTPLPAAPPANAMPAHRR